MANNKLFDRVKMSVSGTPGTGTITLGSAATGYRSFSGAGVANGNVVSYLIEDGSSWEFGTGTYTSTGTTLSRDTVTASSAGGTTKISATSAAVIYITALTADLVQFDSSGNVGIGTSSPTFKLTVTGTGVTATDGGGIVNAFGYSGGGEINFFDAATWVGYVGIDSGSGLFAGTIVSKPISFVTNNSTRMTIDSAGFVGIGTTSPQAPLQLGTDLVLDYAYPAIGFNFSPSTGKYLTTQSAALIQYDWTNNGLKFATMASASAGTSLNPNTANIRMFISSDGNVGIGTSSPNNYSGYATLTVGGAKNSEIDLNYNNGALGVSIYTVKGGSTATDGQKLYAYDSSGAITWYLGYSGSGTGDGAFLGTYNADATTFWTNNTERMRIDSAGNVGIGTTSPSYRLHVDSATSATGLRISASGSGSYTEIYLDSVVGPNYISSNQTIAFYIGGERMRIDSAGNVGIGVIPAGNGLLELNAGSATVAPLKLTSGTNLSTPVAGAVEYDGTVFTVTSNTSFKRGAIPITNYASGTGSTLGTNTEATLAALLPAANDTITLPIGTYYLDVSFIITRGASTTSATARLNILGSGNAAGTFSGMSLSAPTSGGTTGAFSFDAVNINTSNVLTAASTTSGGVYQLTVRGVLKITTAGTIVPQYNLSANINGAGTVAKVYGFILQQLDSQSAAASGPSGTGWA